MTDSEWLNIFVDESGSSDADRLFTCVAVLVNDVQLPSARAAMDAIACSHASGGEIKSKSIGDNHHRRLQFLELIQQVDFQYSALVVDKTAIRDDSGLRFARSFNKFFKRLLHRPLEAHARGGIRAVFDNYGWPDTMREFESYMGNRIAPNLFFEYGCSHVDSKNERLIQLADLIAGTINWCFDPSRRCAESTRFRELLLPRELSITAWPPVQGSAWIDDASDDPEIAENAQLRVLQLIRRFEGSTVCDQKAISIVLEQLLFARLFETGARQSIYADSLPGLLDQYGIEMSTRQVRRLIGSIRDLGVVVAGSPYGYKLALTTADISDYLSHTEGVVGPMLNRVRRARESVKLDTSGRFDILAGNDALRRVIETLGDAALLSLEDRESEEDIDVVDSGG